MFDSYSRSLIHDIPEFEGLTGDATARALSMAYLSIIQFRVNQKGEGVSSAENQSYLRRLANTLTFHIILNEKRPTDERRSAAFVAAESLALTADFISLSYDHEDSDSAHLRSLERYVRLEAALLYLFSRYDACASGVLQLPIPEPSSDEPLVDQAFSWCFNRLERLCKFKPIPALDSDFTVELDNPSPSGSITENTIARLYIDLGRCAAKFSVWLAGGLDSAEHIFERLELIIETLKPQQNDGWNACIGNDYSDIFHLCLLLKLCLPSLSERAIVEVVPVPLLGNAQEYIRYLKRRAAGSGKVTARPVLWPSALEYVNHCLHGNKRHAVVSMPTGSGKSFIGELAVSQAIGSGWALYLAPTNALAEQIRGDLRIGLKSLGAEVFAFIGDQEYSIFSTDTMQSMQPNSVAVMTPEKCALALRLSPEAFKNCRLVVFDECHLIGETHSSRGPVAGLVLSQLMIRAIDCRFLLMSAIVQNPEELSEWLEESLGEEAGAVTIRWRPTRTLRAILGVDSSSFQREAIEAQKELESLPDSRKRLAFGAQCSLATNLQGAWQSTEKPDYNISGLDCDATLSVMRKKEKDTWEYVFNADSWVNGAAISLATRLADQGIQTLVFTPANKHYPFSNGNKLQLKQKTLAKCPDKPLKHEICRDLAEFELGCDSHVFSLLDKGVAVHTSAMLETEKIASEMSFRNRSAPIMFATGTLAQGLNLPAIAVVIAGSRIGDPRGVDREIVKRRKFSQLLNAAGRAGRAGFANQGIVIAVPDDVIELKKFKDILALREQVDYLQQSDDSVRIESGLSNFLNVVCANSLDPNHASELELEVVSLLAGGDDKQLEPTKVLRNTFAAFLRRKQELPDVSESDTAILGTIKDNFLHENKAPDWMTIAAQRAGLNFMLTLAIYHAWKRVRPDLEIEEMVMEDWSVMDWLNEFLRVIAYIPPALLSRHVTMDRIKRVSAQFNYIVTKQVHTFFERRLDWSPPEYWVDAWKSSRKPLRAWMRGDSISRIASIITGIPSSKIPTERIQGKPIPKAIALTGDTWSSLSLIAGGFLAVGEQLFNGKVPMNLASLPMCIKYGCDSSGTLGWFRFGVRLRSPAHILSEKFPPPEFESDEKLKKWVVAQRQNWLNSSTDDEEEIFQSIRGFIKN